MQLKTIGLFLIFFITLYYSYSVRPHSANASEVLVVAYDYDFKPLTFQNQLGAADGLLVDILKGVLESGNIKYQLVPMPWKRLVAETDAGNVDISLPWRHKTERFEKYNMVGPITQEGLPTLLWQKTGDDKNWSSYEDLKGLAVGVRAGFAYASKFENADQFERVQTYSIEELIRMLINERFDIAISAEITMKRAAKRIGLEDQIKPVAGPAIDYSVTYFVVPKTKSDLPDRLQSLLNDFKVSEHYQAILSRYLN